jgi:hypothetical protein
MRRLTVREVARLQTFDDASTVVGSKKNPISTGRERGVSPVDVAPRRSLPGVGVRAWRVAVMGTPGSTAGAPEQRSVGGGPNPKGR